MRLLPYVQVVTVDVDEASKELDAFVPLEKLSFPLAFQNLEALDQEIRFQSVKRLVNGVGSLSEFEESANSRSRVHARLADEGVN